MKRHTVIDNKTGKVSNYSELLWNLAWGLVFYFGLLVGIILF